MSCCLIGLGSNLGDRSLALRAAMDALGRLPETRLLARSAWHSSTPVGGPPGQGEFLNGAVLLATSLAPDDVLTACQSIELQLGRKRGERWGSRTIDLDLLLYDRLMLRTESLTLPHPKLSTRRFVLEPAAEIAPWMIDADSGWTITALLAELDATLTGVAVAGSDERVARLLAGLSTRSDLQIVRWSPGQEPSVKRNCGRMLILAFLDRCGVDAHQLRRMLHLPQWGPVAWVGGDGGEDSIDEALAALASASLPAGAGPT